LNKRKKREKINKQIEDIPNQNNNKKYRKFYRGVRELRTEYKSKICKLVDNT
jgi:hypothetical protein